MKRLKTFERFGGTNSGIGNSDEIRMRYDRRTSYNLTDLMIAVNDNNMLEVKRLVASGVDLDEQDAQGNTASHYAKLKGNDIIFDYLKSAGANIRIRNDFNETSEDMLVYNMK